ncbi:hypothetical protein KPL71_004228 [Citrus sinensis]|uniref:Uncharacterized protein n=1 Tax=Citrus sinensis TaxID=2711 RepID=A0ACB8N4Y5_CITSI|nr:hypothetical protein KPL71_004228 [Citrus sinensis]
MHQYASHHIEVSTDSTETDTSVTESDIESSLSTIDSEKAYADITKLLMAQPKETEPAQTSQPESYFEIPSDIDEPVESSTHQPLQPQAQNTYKPSNGAWFTFDDIPIVKWREKLSEMSAWVDLQMIRPGETIESILMEFVTRFTGSLRDWFDSLGPYRQLQFVQLPNVSSALVILDEQFIGEPYAVFEPVRHLNMKCCSLNTKDLDFHYKRMSILFYKLNGFNDHTLKHVFLASLTTELQPEIQQQLTMYNLNLDNISLGKIFQIVKGYFRRRESFSFMASTSSSNPSTPVTLSSTLSLPKSCTPHTTNKIEHLVEYSYIPESAQISESSYPLISPYQLYKRPSSFTRSIRTLISTRRPHPKEYIQSSRLDQCSLQATPAEQYVTLEIPSELISNWKREGYTYLHLGGIRLILTLHGRKGLPVTARLAMLDTRFKQYPDAVIGTVLTTLHAGSVLLTFYPNFNLSLQDPNLPTTLKVQIQIQGAEQISSAKIATLHHSDTLMVLAESDQIPKIIQIPRQIPQSDQIPTIIQIPRQIPRHELIKLMPLEWISNYEQFHNNTAPIQTSESMFERRQDGTVRMTFKPPPSAPQEPPRLSFTYSSMITAVQTAQEDLPITGFNSEGYFVYPAKHNGHFLWDAPGSGMAQNDTLLHLNSKVENISLRTEQIETKVDSITAQMQQIYQNLQSRISQLDSELRAMLAHRYSGPEFDQKEREIRRLKAELAQIESEKQRPTLFTTSPPIPSIGPTYHPFASMLSPIKQYDPSKLFGMTHTLFRDNPLPPPPKPKPKPRPQPRPAPLHPSSLTIPDQPSPTSEPTSPLAPLFVPTQSKDKEPMHLFTAHTVDHSSTTDNQTSDSSLAISDSPTETDTESSVSTSDSDKSYADITKILMAQPDQPTQGQTSHTEPYVDIPSEVEEEMLESSATKQPSPAQTNPSSHKSSNGPWFTFDDLPSHKWHPSAVFEAARRDYLNMKCCSHNAKDLDFHYKRMSLLFYNLNGFNEPTLKHVFLASLPEELQPNIQRQLTSSNLSLDNISLGKIFQLAKTCLDKLCEQKQFFKELLKDKEPFRSACKKPYLQIKCHKKKDCDCSSKKKRHFRKFKTPEFSSKPRRSRKPYRFFRKKSSSSREFKRKQSSRCFICKRKGHYAKDCPNKREKSIRLVEHLQATTDYSPAKDELEFYFSEQDEPNDETVFALQNSSDSNSDQSQVIFHQQLLSLDTTIPIPSIKLQILPSKFQRPIPAIGLINTGAQRSMLNPHILPSEYWTQSEEHFKAVNGKLFTTSLITKKPIGSHDEHRQLLTQFYDLIQNHGIMLSAKKSTIATDNIEFLDQQLSKRQIQQFLGIINYICDFIPHVDHYTHRLSTLLKKKPPEWNADHTIAVTTLKQIAQNPPPLKLITDGKRILQTDASDESWGAILLEEINRKEHFIAYASGHFSDTQKHYYSVFKEILAVKNGIKKFEYHLIGHHFLIRMDNSAFPNIFHFKVLYATKLILPISPTLEHLLNPDNATSLTWTLLEWFSPIPWWRKKLQQLSEIYNLDRMPAPEAPLFTSVFIIHRPYFQHPDTKLFWTQDQVYEWFTAPHIAVIENDIQDVLHNYLCQLNHQPPPLKDISHTSLGPQHDLLMIPTPSAISKPKSTGPSTQSSKRPAQPSKVDKATQTSPQYTPKCTPRDYNCPYPPCRGPHCPQHDIIMIPTPSSISKPKPTGIIIKEEKLDFIDFLFQDAQDPWTNFLPLSQHLQQLQDPSLLEEPSISRASTNTCPPNVQPPNQMVTFPPHCLKAQRCPWPPCGPTCTHPKKKLAKDDTNSSSDEDYMNLSSP